jgi:exonuclease SbcD
MVRRFFPEQKIETWTDAVRCVLSQAELLPGRRSILLAHQFVTGGVTSDSEESSVGGADNVDAAVFGGFDYVALGHLHGPQRMGRDSLRYSGSPLKYSFSEAGHQKSLTVVEMGPKGSLETRQVPLTPRHDLKELKGSYEQVAGKAFYDALDREDYFRVTLTDEQDQPDAMAKLRVIYPRLMRLDYDNKRTRAQDSLNDAGDTRALSPLELFDSLFREQNGQDLTTQQREYLNEKIGTVWGEAR